MSQETQRADIQMIQRILPHRYPFLLVDRVEEIDGTFVEGGLCGVGGTLPEGLSLSTEHAMDYGQGTYTPEAFQDCVDIMQMACHSACDDGLLDLPDNRAGCGSMPQSS